MQEPGGNMGAKKQHLSESRTETLVVDLLQIQGWKTGRPPKGGLVRQNEYMALDRIHPDKATLYARAIAC